MRRDTCGGTGRVLLAAALATIGLAAGCHTTDSHWVVNDVSVSLPPMTIADRPTERAAMPAEWLIARAGGGQTLLIWCHSTDDPNVFDDERSRTFVIVLDGPPAKGVVEVTPENGRMISATAWLPPRKPYDGLEGRIAIVSVMKNGEVIADCSVRNVLRRSGDPVYAMRGLIHFKSPGAKNVLGSVRVE